MYVNIKYVVDSNRLDWRECNEKFQMRRERVDKVISDFE